jgi:hypothetical protein
MGTVQLKTFFTNQMDCEIKVTQKTGTVQLNSSFTVHDFIIVQVLWIRNLFGPFLSIELLQHSNIFSDRNCRSYPVEYACQWDSWDGPSQIHLKADQVLSTATNYFYTVPFLHLWSVLLINFGSNTTLRIFLKNRLCIIAKKYDYEI